MTKTFYIYGGRALSTGTLYLVGTPIGNLEDLTRRAERVLAEADIIAAEDTRRTLRLLNHLNITKPIWSYHEHNSRTAGEKILNELMQGRSVALVSDAGMPVVSDPGAELVREARTRGVTVTVIPGPCAVSSALALSGMDGSRFLFEGFLPREGKDRRLALEALKSERRTIVFYEAPHRIRKTLKDLHDALGDREAALCNDITKFYERVDRLTLSGLQTLFAETDPKGEYVLVVQGSEEPVAAPCYDNISPAEHVQQLMAQGLGKMEAVKRAARERGVSKNDVYQEVLEVEERE
jgi:16S rRNA (cytidine1402-2'-O)-methyltransferase